MDEMFLEDSSLDLSIDLTPMIDVLFMLLIFFITATTFVKPVIDVNLPSAETAAKGSGSSKQLLVTVTASGEIYLNDELTTLADLALVFIRENENTINLFVDRETPFQAFLAVVDLAKKHKCDDLLVTTEPAGTGN